MAVLSSVIWKNFLWICSDALNACWSKKQNVLNQHRSLEFIVKDPLYRQVLSLISFCLTLIIAKKILSEDIINFSNCAKLLKSMTGLCRKWEEEPGQTVKMINKFRKRLWVCMVYNFHKLQFYACLASGCKGRTDSVFKLVFTRDFVVWSGRYKAEVWICATGPLFRVGKKRKRCHLTRALWLFLSLTMDKLWYHYDLIIPRCLVGGKLFQLNQHHDMKL